MPFLRRSGGAILGAIPRIVPPVWLVLHRYRIPPPFITGGASSSPTRLSLIWYSGESTSVLSRICRVTYSILQLKRCRAPPPGSAGLCYGLIRPCYGCYRTHLAETYHLRASGSTSPESDPFINRTSQKPHFSRVIFTWRML